MSNKDESQIENRKNKWKQQLPNTANISSGLFDDLQSVINSIDLLSEGVSNDYKHVVDFFQKGLAVQCTQGWSYYAQVNEHAKFAETSVKLTKLIAILGSDPCVYSYGSILIRDILSNYCKVLYRGINNLRPSITNSIFRLLTEIVKFNNGQFVDEFTSYFDLSLPSLLKVLTPRKTDMVDVEATKKSMHISMRTHFIKFWIALIENAPSLLKKDILIDNQKIMTAWFKNIAKTDPVEVVEASLKVLINKVLKDESFRKMTKCRILNEFVVSRLHSFYYSSNKEIVSLVDEFFHIYGSDYKLGIIFPEKHSWFQENTSLKSGVTVSINQKEFKLHNKLLYTTLTFFKPWEDDTQCNTVIKILENVPELVAPYGSYISAMGSHDPKMTAFWFGMTLFLGRVINIPVPAHVRSTETDSLPNTSIVIESILPSVITKSSLTKCLQDEVPLIKQMGIQLLVFSLQKLDKVLDVYSEKGWDSSRAILLNTYFNSLPELSILSAVLNSSYSKNPKNKVLPLSLTIVLNLYSKIFPNFFNVVLPSSNIYIDIMKNDKFSGIDLVILDNFLKFQEFNNSQIKWWNASNKDNSLFTSLLRLGSAKNSSSITASKISQLLHNLLQFNVVFHFNKLTSSPLYALINSLSVLTYNDNAISSTELQKIWKLLDETISRCQKTPYKYVDSAVPFGNVSPFIMALVEQWEFVEKDKVNSTIINNWILIFLRNMIILGEDQSSIQKLTASMSNIPENLVEKYLYFSNEVIEELNKPEYLLEQKVPTSCFDYILLLTDDKLETFNRFPVNSFDVSAIVFRLRNLVSNHKLSAQLRNIIDNSLSKIGNYALSDLAFKSRLVCKNYFENFITDMPPLQQTGQFDAYFYLLNGVNQIFSQLDINFDAFRDYCYGLLEKILDFETSERKLMAVGILSNIISSAKFISILETFEEKNKSILPIILHKALRESLSISGDLFLRLLAISDVQVNQYLLKFLKSGLVEDLDLTRLSAILPRNSADLVEECLKLSGFISHFYVHIHEIVDPSTRIVVATYLNNEEPNNAEFITSTVSTALHKYRSASETDFAISLRLFNNHYPLLTKENKEEIVSFITTECTKKYTADIASFILSVNEFEISSIKSWMNKSCLFITKYFAEREQLSEDFIDFFTVVKEIFKKCSPSVWKVINTSILRTQLEVLLSKQWIKNESVLEYICLLILDTNKSLIDSNQLLQLFLNNPLLALSDNTSTNRLKFLTSVVIHRLFFINPVENSNVTLQYKLLEFYKGTVSPSDIYLLEILEQIESSIALSWTNNVISWEFIDTLNENEMELIGPMELISKEKEGLVVTISKDLIKRTLNNFPVGRLVPAKFSKESLLEKWNSIENLYSTYSCRKANENIDVYDPLFLMLSLINSDEFVRNVEHEESSKYIYNIKRFIDTGLLQLIICSLGLTGETKNISRSILEGLLFSIQDSNQQKDKTIFDVLITKILYTLNKKENKQNDTQESDIPFLIWMTVSRISHILSQPSSDLYEKAYRWVLSSPFIKNIEIPLLQAVLFTDNDSLADSENFYKYLVWILQTFKLGLKEATDVKLLRMNNCFEWMYNLQNSPYLHIRLETLIQSIFYRIQLIEGGESLLITGYGSISFGDCQRYILSEELDESYQLWLKNTKNKKNLRSMLLVQQRLVNNLEVSTRKIIVVNSDKRIGDWIDHDEINIAKRLCK